MSKLGRRRFLFFSLLTLQGLIPFRRAEAKYAQPPKAPTKPDTPNAIAMLPKNLVAYARSCSHDLYNLTHVSDLSGLKKALEDSKTQFVVSHGVIPIHNSEFETELSHVELALVFVSDQQTCAMLPKDSLVKILKGDTSTWKAVYPDDVAGNNAQIHLFLHGGNLQRQTFMAMAERVGVQPEDLEKARPKFVQDYQDLHNQAKKDPNALVLGLRSSYNEGLRILPINGVSPFDQDAVHKYPLREFIYIYTRKKSKAAEELKAQWEATLKAKPILQPSTAPR